MLDAVAVECSNRNKPAAQHHRHVQLIGGRAGAAERYRRYPPRLIKAILRGLRKHLQMPAKALAACSAALATLVGSTAPEAFEGFATNGSGQHCSDRSGQRRSDSRGQRRARRGSTAPMAGSPAPQTATSRRISLGTLNAGRRT